LNQMQRDFEEIKELVHDDLTELRDLLKKINVSNLQLTSGFNRLGARLLEVMDAGNPGTTINDFLNDREVVDIVHQLSTQHGACKADNYAVYNKHQIAVGDMEHQLNRLTTDLEREIGTRNKKFSSKRLGINQSVKQMPDLLESVQDYSKCNGEAKALRQRPAYQEPIAIEADYNNRMSQAIWRAPMATLTAEQSRLARRLVDGQALTAALKNAKVIYDGLVRQVDLADKSVAARKAQSLSAARAATKKAVADVQVLVGPYDLAMKNAKVVGYLNRQPRSGEVKKKVVGLVDVQKNINAKSKYITNLRIPRG
jgi:hypothetical protein